VITLVCWLNPWSLIPAVVTVIGLLLIRHRYARCSRDLKRLDGTSRSPYYSYLSSTIDGLKVIRSYHAESICKSEFFAHIDANMRTQYLFQTTTRWAGVRFDFMTQFFIAMVTVLAVIVRTYGRQLSAADIALTLSYSLTLMGLIQWAIR
jgi:ATP-binding cassette, subfamily C (CFTR/MRP), member 4